MALPYLLSGNSITNSVQNAAGGMLGSLWGGMYQQAQGACQQANQALTSNEAANQINNTLAMQAAQSLAQAQEKAARTGCKVETVVDRDFEKGMIRRTVLCGKNPIYWQQVDQQGRLVKDEYVSVPNPFRLNPEDVLIIKDPPKQETKVANETEKEIIPDISLARVGKWAIVLIVLMALGNRFWSMFGPKVSEQLHKALGAETPAAKT